MPKMRKVVLMIELDTNLPVAALRKPHSITFQDQDALPTITQHPEEGPGEIKQCQVNVVLR